MTKWVLLFVVSFIGPLMAAIPIRIDSLTCTGNEQYCSNVNCSVETIRQKMQVINFNCTFNEELDNLLMKFTLFKRDGSNYRNYVIDSTEDLCKVLDKTERSNVISRMMPMWKYYGRFQENCPARGDVSVRRYPLDLAFFPSTFPSGDYKIVLQLIEANKNLTILNATTMFNVKYT